VLHYNLGAAKIAMPVISITAEPIFHIGSFAVTNSLFLAFLTGLILLAVGVVVRSSMSLQPGKLQNGVEVVVDQILEQMSAIFGDRHHAEKYFPLVATVFVFVLTSNWLGLLPGSGSFGVREVLEGHEALVPLLRAPAADLNFTLALAVIVMVSVHLFAVLALGFRAHVGKFITLKSPIDAFVGILELVSEFVKIVSFSFRLFGNIFAGEVLLLIIGFLLPLVLPLPFLLLEVFVGFIQALIFAMLTTVFIAGMTAKGAH